MQLSWSLNAQQRRRDERWIVEFFSWQFSHGKVSMKSYRRPLGPSWTWQTTSSTTGCCKKMGIQFMSQTMRGNTWYIIRCNTVFYTPKLARLFKTYRSTTAIFLRFNRFGYGGLGKSQLLLRGSREWGVHRRETWKVFHSWWHHMAVKENVMAWNSRHFFRYCIFLADCWLLLLLSFHIYIYI